MAVLDDIYKNRERILEAAYKRGIFNVRVFGSCLHEKESYQKKAILIF